MFIFSRDAQLGGFALGGMPILQSPLIGGTLIAANIAEVSASIK